MENRPVRLQRKRTKGFHLESPNGLPNVYVGRPSRWGNPYKVTDTLGAATAVGLYRLELEWYLSIPAVLSFVNALEELRGKNLVCWCPLDAPCHADVLLELANKEMEESDA